ncbi:MAG: hypothetical protein N838_13680 [Thiohalocapsa sp. PB-PSB1]|nr:MAG: hypothetical protein N838_13680 [Thiohalocapsa sp. PB-PSB1]
MGELLLREGKRESGASWYVFSGNRLGSSKTNPLSRTGLVHKLG